jgi:hypothetical protein
MNLITAKPAVIIISDLILQINTLLCKRYILSKNFTYKYPFIIFGGGTEYIFVFLNYFESN